MYFDLALRQPSKPNQGWIYISTFLPLRPPSYPSLTLYLHPPPPPPQLLSLFHVSFLPLILTGVSSLPHGCIPGWGSAYARWKKDADRGLKAWSPADHICDSRPLWDPRYTAESTHSHRQPGHFTTSLPFFQNTGPEIILQLCLDFTFSCSSL